VKVLLVQPWLGREQHPVLPIGLACIAAALHRHSVRIIDLNLHRSPLEALEGTLKEYQPDVTGFSLRNCDTTGYSDPFSYIPAFAEQISLTGRILPGTHVMAGGAGFSIFADQIMENCPGIHCGVTGHGEKLVDELVLNHAVGLFHGRGGEFTPPTLELVDTTGYLPFQGNLSAGVEVNRGCDGHCRYCSYGAVSGMSVRERPAGLIVEDLQYLLGKGFSHFFLIAPVLNSSRRRGEEIASAVSSAGGDLSWEAYHTAKDFDAAYASVVSGSGCTAVSFSPDGGTDRQMGLAGKDYGVKDLEKAMKAAVSAELDVSLNIFPWFRETGTSGMLKAFRNGAEWGRSAGSRLRRLRFGLIRRMPGTVYGPAHPSFTERIHPGEFIRPDPPGMVVYLVLKNLLGRSSIR